MKKHLIGFILVASLACGKKSKDAKPEPNPAILTLPANNEACTNSITISNAESKVKFKWEPAEHADNYELNVKNLISGVVMLSTVDSTETEVTLLRNMPYSWYVVSKSASSAKSSKSSIQRFYNPGPQTVTYAPFPAEAVNPLMNQQMAFGTGKITLDWTASDADSDIVGYDVYLGTTKTPTLLSSNMSGSILNEVSVTANTTYFWKVITKDKAGNTSDSGVFEFRIN